MRSVLKLVKQLNQDEDGATLLEYTVLLAIILIAVIGIIAAVGSWVNLKWSAFNSAIQGH